MITKEKLKNYAGKLMFDMADEEYEFHWSDISINFKTNIENQEKQLIEFYVDGSKLYAEPNMLWIEFVNSQYAPQGTYFINDNKVCLGMIGSIAIDGGAMPIEPNYNYQLLSPEC